MSRTKRSNKATMVTASAQDRARQAAAKLKPAADQVKPLAKSTQAAAGRGLHRTRAWAAPQIERTGQVLQDKVAPKVSGLLSAAARRVEPGKPPGRRWRMLSGISVVMTAAAGAVAAVLRKRKAPGSTAEADEADADEVTGAAGQPKSSSDADSQGAARTS